ncbi:hypothetical protein Tco_1276887, partial [Tanacetum coccineum]
MSYEDIRPIFERVWDQNNTFVPKDYKIEKEVMKRLGFDFQQKSSKQRSREDSDEDNAKKQKLEDDAEKGEQSQPSKMLWERRGIANMAFIQLGGVSRVDEMILARERSGFAGKKVWNDIPV